MRNEWSRHEHDLGGEETVQPGYGLGGHNHDEALGSGRDKSGGGLGDGGGEYEQIHGRDAG